MSTAVILAGGSSSRMGFDKADIPFKGSTLLDYQINELKKIFDNIIVVSNKLKEYTDPRVRVVADEYKNKGPLGGLHIGLKNSTDEFVFLIACDMPFIDIPFLKKLLKVPKDFNEIAAVIFKKNGRLEPFNGLYHKKLRGKIEKTFEDNTLTEKKSFSLKKILEGSEVLILEEDFYDTSMNLFYNMNLPQDLIE